MEKNPYEILGVEKGCAEEELKKAYKQKCFEFHPDKFATESQEKQKEAEDKFKEVQKAYNSIKDGSYEASQQSQEEYGFSDFFSSVFSKFQNRAQKLSNIQVELPDSIQLSFVEAITGCKKHIHYNFGLNCATCGGHGVVPTKNPCKECNGKGTKTVDEKRTFGLFRQTTTCGVCGGSKKEMIKCGDCKGEGHIQYTLEEEIVFEPCYPINKKIIRKIQDIEYVFMLKVQTVIPESTKMEIFENERILAIDFSLPFSDFLLGGKFKLNIEDNQGDFWFETKTGEQYVLVKDKGFPHKGLRLPLKINISPKIPTELTEKQKEVLNNLKNLGL